MGYSESVDELWQLDVRRAGAARIEALLEKCASQMDASLGRAQALESLAVAGAFAEAAMDWTTPRMRALADAWIAALCAALGLQLARDGGLGAPEVRAMAATHVQPYFSGARAARHLGYALAGAEPQGAEPRGEHGWRRRVQSVGAFAWTLHHVDAGAVCECVASVLPVVLALVEDHECWARVHGLRAARVLVARDAGFARRSGIGALVAERVRACVVFRAGDALAGAELREAFAAFVAVTDAVSPSDARAWFVLCERIVVNAGYIGENVEALGVVCAQVSVACARLGVAVARFMRPFVGVLAGVLRAPVCAPKVVALHAVAAAQVGALADACPLRMRVYVVEAVAALARSWDGCVIGSETDGAVAGTEKCTSERDALRQGIRDVVAKLRAIDADAVARAVQRLNEAQPGRFGDFGG
ncbi:hypothetical protein IWW50_005350 [Coemansia erecta]|nr:hypothetical protein GGF43_004809 [Coemansia sp. RSA 2618]KAJ2819735.1 hypothetical protein IWW50_005350 [Coemansia erecta]